MAPRLPPARGLPPPGGLRPLYELPLLALAVASPALPFPWSLPLLAVAVAVWGLRTPLRRERWAFGLAGALALLALAWPAWSRAGAERDWWPRAAEAYGAVWSELATSAQAAAGEVGPPRFDARQPDQPDASWVREVFARLAVRAASEGRGRTGAPPALFVVDPDGRVVAWAGDGLRHEVEQGALPRRGAGLRVSFEAATLLWAEPLAADERPWRVVSGSSHSLDGLAFAPAAPRGLRWVPVTAAAGDIPADIAELVAAGGPAGELPRLWLRVAPAPPGRSTTAGRAAWWCLGGGLVALAALRLASLALLAGTVLQGAGRQVAVGALAGLGGASLALGAGATPAVVGCLALGALVAAAGAGRPRLARRARVGWRGLAAGALLFCGVGVLSSAVRVPALDESLGGPPDVIVMRLAVAGLAWGLLRLAGGQRERGEPRGQRGERWVWLAVVLLLAAAAVPDRFWWAAALVVAGGGAIAHWVSKLPLRGEWLARGLLVLLAALAAGASWQAWSRLEARQRLETAASAFAPPGEEVRSATIEAVRQGFLGRDLAELGPEAGERERQDLALALWRRSPLARRDARSALVIEPFAAAPIAFSFGVPLVDGDADLDRVRWPEVVAPGWEEAVLRGEAVLGRHGEPWGRLRFWLVPRPGFGLAAAPPRAPGASLLRDEPGQGGIEEAPDGVQLAVLSPQGRLLATPWRGLAELPPPLRAAVAASPEAAGRPVSRVSLWLGGSRARAVATPDGRAWMWVERRRDATHLVFLPWRSAVQAVERCGTQVVATLFALVALLAAAGPLALGRAPVRDALRRAVRSYPRRLLLVTVAIAVLPLLVVNAVVLQDAESRLERQRRAEGEAALGAAQRVLGEYLASLDPGYGLDTALDARLLGWLSDVVHHEVNVYWGSRLYRSSRQELFATGLLPRRLPGEVWSQLELEGGSLVVRENRLREGAGPSWVELYAPLRLPGGGESDRLVLSLPSLAQQEGVAQELARERRRILLATVAALLLLLAVSVRLARSFGRPVSELVEGTRRIAAGAAGLGLGPEAVAPREPELAELVGAVDEMARRIAGARESLLREKQVVERVVENITAGVVSVDAGGRVSMCNRVAAELLGVTPGEVLLERLAASSRLAPLLGFVRERLGRESGTVRAAAASSPQQVALRLPPAATVVPDPPPGATTPGPVGVVAGEPPAERAPATEDREWTVTWVPVPGSGSPAALLVVEDSTEVLRGQRLAAWAEMARIIAHEVKNPLTPIRLSAEHLREVWRRDPEAVGAVIDRCVSNILRHVEELRDLASEFAVYSRISQLERQPTDLEVLVSEVVSGYATAPPPGVTIRLEAETGGLVGSLDRRLVTRAVRNLVENAVRASLGGGEVVVSLGRRGPWVEVRVADRGPGVPSELLRRIFEPYFSTHAGGTGLGLAITQRIAVAHGGDVVAHNREGGGLEVVMSLELPLAP
jgi:signal transduction histidine kinase